MVMVHQRIGSITFKSEVLFLFFFMLLLLLVELLLDSYLSRKIKGSRLYACSKALAKEHALNNSVWSDRIDGSSKRPSSVEKRPSRK
jgi:hypothetical protein